MTNQKPKWSIPFDKAQRAKSNLEYDLANWHTLDQALKDLKEYSESLVRTTNRMEELNYDVSLCVEHWLETANEPPNEYFGIAWIKNTSFDRIFAELQRLTNEGHDVREQWRAFRTALALIWRQLPHYYIGVRIAIDNAPPPLYTSSEDVQDQKQELYDATELPSDYDSLKPFPQYQIPSDIDE